MLPPFTIPKASQSHAEGKAARSCKVTDGLIDTQRGFSKGGCPLSHRTLGCTCGNHQDEEGPEGAAAKELGHAHTFRIRNDGFDGTSGEIQDVIERDDGPEAGKNAPVGQPEEAMNSKGVKLATMA